MSASPDERLVTRRARVVDARADLRRAKRAYFSALAPTRDLAEAYEASLQAYVDAQAALEDARIASAIEGRWIGRPDMYRA